MSSEEHTEGKKQGTIAEQVGTKITEEQAKKLKDMGLESGKPFTQSSEAAQKIATALGNNDVLTPHLRGISEAEQNIANATTKEALKAAIEARSKASEELVKEAKKLCGDDRKKFGELREYVDTLAISGNQHFASMKALGEREIQHPFKNSEVMKLRSSANIGKMVGAAANVTKIGERPGAVLPFYIGLGLVAHGGMTAVGRMGAKPEVNPETGEPMEKKGMLVPLTEIVAGSALLAGGLASAQKHILPLIK